MPPQATAGAPAASGGGGGDDDALQLYAVRLFDRADASALRAATRDAHLSWARDASNRVHFGGPLRRAPSDASPLGSLLVLSAAPGALDAVLASDPYAAAGLFARHEACAWRRGMVSALNEGPHTMFVVWCTDRGDLDALALRAATRPAHLQWWKDAGRRGMIGPFPNPDAQQGGAVGTLIVCSGESVDDVAQWAATDPYNKAGLFSSVDVYAMTRVIEWDE